MERNLLQKAQFWKLKRISVVARVLLLLAISLCLCSCKKEGGTPDQARQQTSSREKRKPPSGKSYETQSNENAIKGEDMPENQAPKTTG